MYYLYIILGYFLVLLVLNFLRAKKVKSQDDFMVAGRSLNVYVMVFTLICTWIGSGTFIAGAEFAAKAGWSSLWLPAGAWVGIIIIYFLAGKIRTFGQYTIGDILEVRYGKLARLIGATALIISFTAIVSYQFRAGGYILNVITDGSMSVEKGQFLTFLFVVIFTASAGMIAVAYTDLPNGIIILTSTIIATPIVVKASGGWEKIKTILPHSHFQIINESFGANPTLKALSYFLATMLLLLGVQSMYQKFYSAKTPKDAKKAVSLWVIGTIIVETVVIVIAIFASAKYWNKIKLFMDTNGKEGLDPASIILVSAKNMVPPVVGVLLLGAATAVVISTGMNYLLSSTTNIMRDIYQKTIKEKASQKEMVLLQKVSVIIIGILAYILATKMQSVLEMSYFAYTIYGVSITPALIAALSWKRVTKKAGLFSILLGSITALFLKIIGYIDPSIMVPSGNPNGDPWGIPIIFPSFVISLLALIVITYFTPPPSEEEIEPFFKTTTKEER